MIQLDHLLSVGPHDKLRFPKPVCTGDTLRTRFTVKEKLEDPKRKSSVGREAADPWRLAWE